MLEADYQAFMKGDMPPWLERLQAKAERTIVERGLFDRRDGVMAGLSGGKDSLCLMLILALCRRRPDLETRLEAVLVDWDEAPIDNGAMGRIREYCDLLRVPLRVSKVSLPAEGKGGRTTCYGCARKRKELVFSEASKRGFGVVAFGHHKDDAAQTALMNLLERGKLEGMPASRSFFGGMIRLVRPLIEVPEASLANAARRLGLPVASIDCPRKADNARDGAAPLMAALAERYPRSRDILAGLGDKSLNLTENDATVREG